MRHGWRDTVRTASDVAVLGYLMVLAALPVVTAGAAVMTGAYAVGVYVREDRWPPAVSLRDCFRRSFWPGLGGPAVVGLGALILVVDFLAVRSGRAPGGVPVLVILIVLAVIGAGRLGLAVVMRMGKQSCSSAYVSAVTPRPRLVAAAAGVTGVVVMLALLVAPVLVPGLAGGWLFALDVLAEAQPVTENELVTKSLPPADEVIS